MRVHIVCYEDVHAWILGKFALKLQENLTALGVRTDISKRSDRTADVNHHIIYFDYDATVSSLDTVMVTHIDFHWKLARLAVQLQSAEMGVCTSRETMENLAAQGLPRERLCFVNPAHDFAVAPRPLKLGITSKVQASGCKRENLLVEALEALGPSGPTDFCLEIMGAGWDAQVERLRAIGYAVAWRPAFNRPEYLKLIPTLDYYLYVGMDEGSMGTLDALAAGVPTIVTPQGFHLDVPGGIDHPFVTAAELTWVLRGIAEKRRAQVEARVHSVASLTWRNYAKNHLLMWEFCLRRRQGKSVPSALAPKLAALGIGAASSHQSAALKTPRVVSGQPFGRVPVTKAEDLRLLFVYPEYSSSRAEAEHGLCARLRANGLRARAFGVPCTSWLPFAALDSLWKTRNPYLLKQYETILKVMNGFDALVAAGGSMVHPGLLEEVHGMGKASVFLCADDPESSEILSRPVAASFDACMVMNAACLDDYRSWGVRDPLFLFHPIREDLLPADLDEAQIAGTERDIDCCFFGERVYMLSDRHVRLDALKAAFPQMLIRGKGWPRGFASDAFMTAAYRRTRIGFNLHNSTGPCNSRATHLPAMGVMQLCDNASRLKAIFEPDVEIVGFETIPEAIELARHFLTHPEERIRIAQAGFRRARHDYTEAKWFLAIARAVLPHVLRRRKDPCPF